MRSVLTVLITVVLSVGGVVLPTAEASASHPAAFPHTHTRPVPRRAVAPRSTRGQRVVRLYSDVYGGVNVGGSILAGGTFSQLSTINPTGVMIEGVSGWRTNPWLALELSVLIGLHADEDPTTRDLALIAAGCANAKMYLNPNWRRFEPYALLGVGLYAAAREAQQSNAVVGVGSNDTGEINAAGIGIQAGVGVDMHLNPIVSLSGDLTYRGAFWEDDALQAYFQSFITTTVGIKLKL